MAEQFTTSAFIPALPIAVYLAWMDGDIHSEMTGAKADSAPVVGRPFSAWDGYIAGINLELEPGRRIVQSWRTREFPEDAPDSRVTITLLPEGNGTRLTLMHQDIPDGQGEMYRRGWQEHYFRPMQEYFVGEGIAGAPADAGVTEVIRRVSEGQAGMPPVDPDELMDDSVETDPVAAGGLEVPIGDVNAIGTYASAAGDKPREGHAQFEPVDDDQEDEALETSETREEWWGHLKPPKETKKIDKEEKDEDGDGEKIPDTEPELNRPDDLNTEDEEKPTAPPESNAGTRRKRARRKPVGAGKPAKGRKAGKKATTGRKPAKKTPVKRKKTAGKATKKKPAGAGKRGGATRKKPVRKSPAKSKQAAKKKPTRKAAAKAGKSTKKAATKRKPAGKKTGTTRAKAAKKKPASGKKSSTRKKPTKKSTAKPKKPAGTRAKSTKKKATGRKKPATKKPATRKKPKKKPASPKRAAGKKPRKGRKG